MTGLVRGVIQPGGRSLVCFDLSWDGRWSVKLDDTGERLAPEQCDNSAWGDSRVRASGSHYSSLYDSKRSYQNTACWNVSTGQRDEEHVASYNYTVPHSGVAVMVESEQHHSLVLVLRWFLQVGRIGLM